MIIYNSQMLKLSTKFVIVVLAAEILIGATTTTIITGSGIKSNFALAQLRFPFQDQPRIQQQQPDLRVPLQGQQQLQQQQPLAAPTARAFPTCNGCVSTQDLANGAVTNPKLAAGSVSSANIGAGQVATGNIADGAVSTQKISPGAIPPKAGFVTSSPASIQPGGVTSNGAQADCPSGDVATDGGYTTDIPSNGQIIVHASVPITQGGIPLGWGASAFNTSPDTAGSTTAWVVCAQPSP